MAVHNDYKLEIKVISYETLSDKGRSSSSPSWSGYVLLKLGSSMGQSTSIRQGGPTGVDFNETFVFRPNVSIDESMAATVEDPLNVWVIQTETKMPLLKETVELRAFKMNKWELVRVSSGSGSVMGKKENGTLVLEARVVPPDGVTIPPPSPGASPRSYTTRSTAARPMGTTGSLTVTGSITADTADTPEPVRMVLRSSGKDPKDYDMTTETKDWELVDGVWIKRELYRCTNRSPLAPVTAATPPLITPLASIILPVPDVPQPPPATEATALTAERLWDLCLYLGNRRNELSSESATFCVEFLKPYMSSQETCIACRGLYNLLGLLMRHVLGLFQGGTSKAEQLQARVQSLENQLKAARASEQAAFREARAAEERERAQMTLMEQQWMSKAQHETTTTTSVMVSEIVQLNNAVGELAREKAKNEHLQLQIRLLDQTRPTLDAFEALHMQLAEEKARAEMAQSQLALLRDRPTTDNIEQLKASLLHEQLRVQQLEQTLQQEKRGDELLAQANARIRQLEVSLEAAEARHLRWMTQRDVELTTERTHVTQLKTRVAELEGWDRKWTEADSLRRIEWLERELQEAQRLLADRNRTAPNSGAATSSRASSATYSRVVNSRTSVASAACGTSSCRPARSMSPVTHTCVIPHCDLCQRIQSGTRVIPTSSEK